ncbi:hypothetical protein CLV43_108251 [Umezawaea tangerina]|uniref:Uncharacterized protein n=2 Tax=Umezawaea tangerina TaxID=84725 RepID=A0A2T0SZK7_9PSEU|nr:hypothetical protein CLV43_108251 [Umezawaea tangerina]
MRAPSRFTAILAVLAMAAMSPGTVRVAPEPTGASPFAVSDPAPRTAGSGTAVGPEGTSVVVGAAQVVVPPDAVPAGHTFRIADTLAIRRNAAEIYGQPVGLDHDAPLAKPVTVRWTLPLLSDVQRASLVLVRWDSQRNAWRPEPEVPFRIEDDVLVADLDEFSFWDWVANVGQVVGEIVGVRKDGPTCGGAELPVWVRDVVDPDEGMSAAAIRVCFEADHDDIVTVRVVNNRTFTQQLVMSQGGQRWAWTWPGPDGFDVSAALDGAAHLALDSDTAYLLPPLTEVAVGIDRPSEPGSVVIAAKASATPISVLVDVLRFALDQVNIGGFDNPLLNALVQATFECGGQQLLARPDLSDAAQFVQVAIDAIGTCATEIRRSDSEFGMRFEQLSLAAIKKVGKVGDDVVIKANRLAYQAAGAFKALTFAKMAFYVSDQLQNAAVGPLSFSVRGDGRPPQLGAWTPSCGDVRADANLLYRNLALQDAFRDTAKQLWEYPDWDSASATAVRPLKTCSTSYLRDLAVELSNGWADRKSAEIVADKIRALVAAVDPKVIGFGGVGTFTLGLTATELGAMGFANKGNQYSGMTAECVGYAKSGSPLTFSVESKTGRVLSINTAGTDPSLRTEIGGIRVGSTLADVRKAFAGYEIEEHLAADFGQGSNGVIINGPSGSIGLSLTDATPTDYASGRPTVSFLNGVGVPGHAPTNKEDGC